MNRTQRLSLATGAIVAALMLSAPPLYAGDDIGVDKAQQLLQAGTIKSFDALNKAALAKHPGATIGETELEQEHGNYIYQVELRDAQGVQWDVEVNAATGEVMGDRQDD